MARLLPPERDIGVMGAPVRSSLALAGIFLLVVLAVALLERIGIAPGAALSGVVGAAFALFALAALISQSRRAADFYVSDRKVSGQFGGLAAAGTLAGLLVLGLAGGAYESAGEFLLSVTGFSLGFLVLGFFIGPRLRGFGAYAPGDVLALRFGGVAVRLAWAAIGFSSSFLLFAAVLTIAAPLLETLLGIENRSALYLTAALMLMALLPGGMRSLTWTQAIQFFVIAIACVAPSVYLVLAEPGEERALVAALTGLLSGGLIGGGSGSLAGALPSALLAAVGVASLPQLMSRSLAAVSKREAGTALIWGVAFAVVLTLAGLVLVELLIASMRSQPIGDQIEQIGALLAALPAVLSGLALAGALAALFALGEAALLSAATALSHELFEETVDRRAPEGRRIVAARLILVGVAAASAASAPWWGLSPPALLQWALALAAAGGFVPLLLSLHWKRCTRAGALGGMTAGFGFTGVAFLVAAGIIPAAGISTGWVEIGAPVSALAGLAIALCVTVGVSLAAPVAEAQGEAAAPVASEARRRPPIRERPA